MKLKRSSRLPLSKFTFLGLVKEYSFYISRFYDSVFPCHGAQTCELETKEENSLTALVTLETQHRYQSEGYKVISWSKHS